MAVLNILNITAAAFYLYLFIAVKRMKVRQREHRILSLTALALFQWTFTAYFVYNGNNVEVLRVLLPISCFGLFFFFPLNFHFSYSVVHSKPLPKPLFAAIYSIGAVFWIIQFFHPFSMRVIEGPNGSAVLSQAIDSPLNPVWMLYALSCWFVPTVFYIRYRKAADLNREKKQANLLITTIVLTIIIVMGEYYLTPLLPWWNMPSQSPILFTLWVGAMVYAIWKYGFLRISPGQLTEKILDSVEDLVILYSMDGNAVYRNRKAASILGDGKIHRGEHADHLETAIAPLLRDQAAWTPDYPEKQLSLRVWQHTEFNSGTESFTIKFRIKPVLDRFDDPLGVLATGTMVPRYTDILESYLLSKRESEVLEYLMAGWTIEKTARTLYITERTVKAHISSIYEKTGATNRIELANMLMAARS